MYSRAELASAFRAIGVAAADTVMLHASIRAVGPVAGGPDQIHLAVKDALTPEGTLIMYASCPEYVDEVGRGHLDAEQERELVEKLPAFDPFTARSQRENGALVELFRTYPGSVVNPHVARFVVWGRQSGHLIAPQPWDYAFGRGSLLDRFVASSNHRIPRGKDMSRNLFFDTCVYETDYLALTIKQWGVNNICFGTEAPGSGGAVRQESDHPGKVNVGKTSDDLLPVIDAFDFLSEDDKVTIINKNPATVFPAFAKVGAAVGAR